MLVYDIVVDHGETSNKCTILPLAYRSDFNIMRGDKARTLAADILLHPEGVPLQSLNREEFPVQRLAAIDCVWRRLSPILQKIAQPLPLLVRIPAEFVTAYPRASRKDFDPEGGLATIEAIFIAAAFLGNWDQSLLREYYFAEKFIEDNASTFRFYGINPEIQRPIFQPHAPRDSQTRRLGRGRNPKLKV